MDMTINVKQIGIVHGSVGWLAHGLQDGSLRLEEGHCKDRGNHGLWLKGEGLSQCLALYDQWDLSQSEYLRRERIQYAPYEPELAGRNIVCTDAAWSSLMAIAQQWCDQCNQGIATEQPVEIKIVRVNQ